MIATLLGLILIAHIREIKSEKERSCCKHEKDCAWYRTWLPKDCVSSNTSCPEGFPYVCDNIFYNHLYIGLVFAGAAVVLIAILCCVCCCCCCCGRRCPKQQPPAQPQPQEQPQLQPQPQPPVILYPHPPSSFAGYPSSASSGSWYAPYPPEPYPERSIIESDDNSVSSSPKSHKKKKKNKKKKHKKNKDSDIDYCISD